MRAPRLGARQRAERVAACLEVRELVEGGAGRRQQHGGLAVVARAGGGAGRAHRRLQRADRGASARGRRGRPRSRRRPCRSGSPRGRCPDAGRRLRKPPGLGLPPAIQKMLAKLASDFSRRVGVGGLAVVDPDARARRGRPPPCGAAGPRKLGKPGGRLLRRQAERADGGVGDGDVLPVVPAAQVARGRRRSSDLASPPSSSQPSRTRDRRPARLSSERDRRRPRGRAPRSRPRQLAAGRVVDADHRRRRPAPGGGRSAPWRRCSRRGRRAGRDGRA